MNTATQMELPAMEAPRPERVLRVTFNGIVYKIDGAPRQWRAPFDDCLVCLHCDDYINVVAPNLLHRVPFGVCNCSSSFLQPVDESDRGLLELMYPASEADAKLAERFHRELSRLRAPK